MSLSKLLILVVCCLVLAYSAPLLDCDKLSSYCQPYGTAWWRNRATYCFNCDDKVYHCARDYDDPEVHREGCAAEKNCSAGEEPHLSFKQNGQAVTDPVVYCNPCYDYNYYNRVSRLSSTYSECPNEKRNDCSSGKHKIFCETEDLTDERYCRCDARKGFSPINDFSYVKCSYKDYECLDDYKCPNLRNGKAQQMLLNYTCAAVCDDGYDRLSEDSDDCLLKTTVATFQKPTTIIPPIPEKNKTTDSSRIPAPASTQIPTCSEECDQFSTCHNGTCVCVDDACSDPYEPVCGYDAKSEKYRTFPSGCELNRTYCRQKQFVFYSDGECITAVPGETNNKISLKTIIVIVCLSLVCVLLVLGIFFCIKSIRQKHEKSRKHKEKSCPGPENSETNGQPPTYPLIVVTDIDGSQSNRRRTERQSSAPLSIEEDSSTPALQRSNHTTIIYKTEIHGPYIKSSRNTQINLQDNSPKVENENIKMKHDDDDDDDDEEIEDTETDPLLVPKTSNSDFPEVPIEVTGNKDNQKPLGEIQRADSAISVNALNVDDNTFEENKESDLRKNEEDIDGKPITKQLPVKKLQEKKSFGSLERTTSVSYDDMLVQETRNIESLFADKASYHKMTIKVYKKCSIFLLTNMLPDQILDLFLKKEMFEYTVIRDMCDIQKRTEKSRSIVHRLIESGPKNYTLFKDCLKETKQHSCLVEVESVQKDVLVEMNILVTEPERTRHHSTHHDSMPHIKCIPDEQDETQELKDLKTDDNSDASDQNHYGYKPKEKASSCEEITNQDSSEKEKASGQPYEMQEQKHENRSSKCVVEVLTEEECYRYLQNLKETVSNHQKNSTAEVESMFKGFIEVCGKILENLLDFSADCLLPDHLADSLQFPENYQNTPPLYQAYRTSGKENSCLYQSISLLLTGSDDMQYRLRLLATLHAVKSLEYYKKQLLFCPLEKLKLFFHSNFGEQMDLSELDNAETLVDVCLKSLIMETACLGTDSSVLHVRFLCGALGVKIIQHFQQYSDYGKSLETIPWEQILLEKPLNGNLPDLHIFWVNHGHNEKGSMNHIVPLLPVKTTQEDSESSV